MCAWNVGVTILLKHQLAIVPQGAIAARNIFEGVGRLQGDDDFMSIATSMWDFRSDFLRNVNHVAAVLRDLVNEPSVPTVVAVLTVSPFRRNPAVMSFVDGKQAQAGCDFGF